jgi:hypothetical protein
MGGTSRGESSSGCRIHRRRGGTGSGIVSRNNELHSEHHRKEDQDLDPIAAVGECQQPREKARGCKRKMKKTKFGGGCPGEGSAPEVN